LTSGQISRRSAIAVPKQKRDHFSNPWEAQRSRRNQDERAFRREAVGKLPGSDDFLYINDKESILRWVISVSEAPLRPPAALL
jgi:hypothetical protein